MLLQDALKTDEMKVELMRAKNGEVNSFLQKQMLEKQARAEHERQQRLNTPGACTDNPTCAHSFCR